MSHLDEGLLTCLLDGELSPEERRAAEAHLAACGECRGLYEEIRAVSTEADALVTAVELPRRPAPPPARATGAPAPPPRRPLPWRHLAWAATVVVAIGLGYYARREGPPASSTGMAATDAVMEREIVPAAPAPVPAESGVSAQGFTLPRAASSGRPGAAPPQPTGERDNAAPPAEARSRRDADLADAANPPPQPAAGAVASLEGSRAEAAKQARAARPMATAPVVAFQQVAMEEAVRTLGGTIRLLDGLKPQRVLTGSGSLVPGARPDVAVVRVVYDDPPGRELWLDQQRGPAEEAADVASAMASLLPGDTVAAPAARGMQSVQWIDQTGFRLALTGFLPTDSLRALMRRVE